MSCIRVDIIEIITTCIISFCFLNICTLNFSAAILALLASVEVVAVALTAAVSELLADAVATVVEPLDLILGARAVFVGQETEFCGRLYYSPVAVSLRGCIFEIVGNVTCSKLFDLLPRRGWRGDGRLAPVDAILLAHEVILIPAASTVIELSAMLLVGVVVPSLSVIATLTQESG